MLDKKQIKNMAKRHGFHVSGDFLIRSRSADVISGLAIDATPSAIYIWTFLLPAFDYTSFLHMTLGSRVADLTVPGTSIDEVFDRYQNSIYPIKTANQLFSYLSFTKAKGEYADWTRFICLVRCNRFDEADTYIGSDSSCFRSESILRKLKIVQEKKVSGGWVAVQDLLVDWASSMNRLLDRVPSEL